MFSISKLDILKLKKYTKPLNHLLHWITKRSILSTFGRNVSNELLKTMDFLFNKKLVGTRVCVATKLIWKKNLQASSSMYPNQFSQHFRKRLQVRSLPLFFSFVLISSLISKYQLVVSPSCKTLKIEALCVPNQRYQILNFVLYRSASRRFLFAKVTGSCWSFRLMHLINKTSKPSFSF